MAAALELPRLDGAGAHDLGPRLVREQRPLGLGVDALQVGGEDGSFVFSVDSPDQIRSIYGAASGQGTIHASHSPAACSRFCTLRWKKRARRSRALESSTVWLEVP